jgi:hypothetical protein
MNFDSYRTVAEVSIALTGFVGIIVILQHKNKSFARLQLVGVLQTTLGAALFSFIPDFLENFLDAEAAWRLACGSFGLYHLYLIVSHQAKQRGIRKNTPFQLALTIASFPVVGLKLAVGLGFLLAYAYDIYYLGLLWFLGVASYMFAVILLDDSGASDDDG